MEEQPFSARPCFLFSRRLSGDGLRNLVTVYATRRVSRMSAGNRCRPVCADYDLTGANTQRRMEEPGLTPNG